MSPALWRSCCRRASPTSNHDGLLSDDVKAHLCATARTASSPAKTDPRYPKWYGCGIVNVQDAILTNPPTPPDNGAPIAAPDAATTAEDTPSTSRSWPTTAIPTATR